MNWKNYLHETLGFSNYEIAQIRYIITTIASELSKFFLIGLTFLLCDKLGLYLFSAVLLGLLRCVTGGIHFTHYLPCLLMSYIFFLTDIYLLTPCFLPNTIFIPLLVICLIINIGCAPVVSVFRPTPNKARIKRSRLEITGILILYLILIQILPKNLYINSGFWMIILQTGQLLAAKILQRRSKNNEIPLHVSYD